MQARADWWTDEAAGLGGIAPERLVFLDESAVLTSMARRYGRSPRGQRATAKVPFGHWKRLSVLSALGIEGFLATMSVKDATDAAIFAAYLEQVQRKRCSATLCGSRQVRAIVWAPNATASVRRWICAASR